MWPKTIPFKEVHYHEFFSYNGNVYMKKSTRTACMKVNPKLWFYFSLKSNVTINPGKI